MTIVLIGIGVLLVLEIAAIVVSRIMRRRRLKNLPDRPSYQYGVSLEAWEKACQESLRWSQARRDNKEGRS